MTALETKPSTDTTPQAPETQDAPPEAQDKATAKPDAKPQEAAKPEAKPYEFKAPEGHELDADTVKVYADAAKELGITQDAAQRMLDRLAPVLQERQSARVADAQERMTREWVDAVSADKEIGGEGMKANLAVAKSALDRFGTPQLTQFLNESGLGNHPELIRAFYRAGKAISADSIVTRNGETGQGRTGPRSDAEIAERLYGEKEK